jgi:hypothetical protein
MSLRTVIKSKPEGKMQHRTARSPMRSGSCWLLGGEEEAS